MFKKIDKKKRIEQISIDVNYTLAEALKTMDKSNVKLLLVLNKSKLISLLSIGDIQRAILNGKPLNDLVGNNLRASINVAYEYEEIESIKKRMLEERMNTCLLLIALLI
jgi:predicted transcriptional regulator